MVSRVGSLLMGVGISIGLMAVLTLTADGYRVSEQGVTTLRLGPDRFGGLLVGSILTAGGPLTGRSDQ